MEQTYDPTISVTLTINYEDGREINDLAITEPVQLADLGRVVAETIVRNHPADNPTVSSLVITVVT